METRFNVTNGQEARTQDVTTIGDNAALADDRLLWEMLRLANGSATPQKAVIPYGISGGDPPSGLSSAALIHGGAADGSVRVLPCRIVIGSTTAVGTSVVEHLRGVRSGYLLGTSTLHRTVSISANASGNPRWTLVYAVVTPDANGDSALVKVKNPSTGAVTDQTLFVNKKTTVTISTLDGTPAGSPTRPSLPADSAGNYNVPLAYIWVPNGHGASSTINNGQIHEHCPVLPIATQMGVSTLAPANKSYEIGGTVDTRQSGATSATRPGAYLPSTMVGGESRLILLQLGLSPVSHNDGDVVDDSVDWRYRYFTWFAAARAGNTTAQAFASDRAGTSVGRAPLTSNGVTPDPGYGVSCLFGFGQSFYDDDFFAPSTPADNNGMACGFGGTASADATTQTMTELGGSGANVFLYVRDTDGALIFKKTGTTTAQVIIRLDATAQYRNAA